MMFETLITTSCLEKKVWHLASDEYIFSSLGYSCTVFSKASPYHVTKLAFEIKRDK